MKAEIIRSLTNDFESYARQTKSGIEFWLVRDLQCLLGYTDWRNFLQVVNRAKVACEVSEHRIIDHFVDANKMVSLGFGSQREVPDMMLTRYACYLIAQNGDKSSTVKRCWDENTRQKENVPWGSYMRK